MCLCLFFSLRSARRSAGRATATRAKFSLQPNFHRFLAKPRPPPSRRSPPPSQQRPLLSRKWPFPYGNALCCESRTLRSENRTRCRERNTLHRENRALRRENKGHCFQNKGLCCGTFGHFLDALTSGFTRIAHFLPITGQFRVFHRTDPRGRHRYPPGSERKSPGRTTLRQPARSAFLLC